MKRSRDIEVSRLTAELNSTQFKLAFYMEKAENSVSREDYAAIIAERDAAISQTETIVKLHAEEKAALQAKHAAELAGVQDSLKEYQEAQALLQTENVDLKTLLLHAYLQDNRLEPMVQLLARLFQAF